MKPLLPPCLFLNITVHMSNNTPSECYLFSSEPNKAFCHTLYAAHKAFCHTLYTAHTNQHSSNTRYALCTSVMHYFTTLSIHQNFNPCINPTTLMDMPIPLSTFHSTSLITETYATHTHRYIPLCFVKHQATVPLYSYLPSASDKPTSFDQ